MTYKTFAQIKTKIYAELDLETEDFIQADEFLGYVNDGISICEAIIHKLGLEDEYFLTKTTLNLVSGSSDITLPTNLYMNKIRKVLYSYNNQIFPVDRLRGKNRFENRELLRNSSTGSGNYYYLIRNDAATAVPVLELVPSAVETATAALTLWYIREAAKWASTSTVDSALNCDLPSVALQFLYQYVKFRCYAKEGHPNVEEAQQEMATFKGDMIAALEQMVEDGDTVVEADMTHYQEST